MDGQDGGTTGESRGGRAAPWWRRRPVLAGFLLMYACTWPVDLWAAAASHGAAPEIPFVLPLLVGYGFVVAAVTMTWLLDGRAGVVALLRRFLVWRVGLWWWAVALFGWFAIDLAAIGIDVLLGGAVPDFDEPFARQLVGPGMALWAVLPVFLLFGVLTNGEEIAWRGFALPRLQQRHTALTASVVIGLVWALWHVPKFLTADSAQDYPFWLYTVDTVAKAVIFTWVFNGTRGSLLVATFLHASLNTSAVFLPILPAATGTDGPLLVSIALHCLVAVVLVLVTGPARLSRTPEPDVPVRG